MRQNTKKKRSGFGYFIRMFLLLVELLAVTLFLWGNDAYSISATTPEFKWENYKTIAHALGGIGDKTYLNSKESFLAGYQMGCRLFEVDLVKTSDMYGCAAIAGISLLDNGKAMKRKFCPQRNSYPGPFMENILL